MAGGAPALGRGERLLQHAVGALGPGPLLQARPEGDSELRADVVPGVRAAVVLLAAERQGGAAQEDRDAAGSGGGAAAQLGGRGACAVVRAAGPRAVRGRVGPS